MQDTRLPKGEQQMAKCYKCERGAQYGHKVSHAKNRTNRRFDVNLQRTIIIVGGKKKRVELCTRCLRTMMAVR